MRETTIHDRPAVSGAAQSHPTITRRNGFTEAQARSVASIIGLDLDASEFDVEAFRRGMEVELEHGRRDPETNVTDDDPVATGRIAWAHLKELPDYYDRLEAMEASEGHGGPRDQPKGGR